jgi:hypothetical protein
MSSASVFPPPRAATASATAEPASVQPAAAQAATSEPVSPTRRWRIGAFLLTGAAQIITIASLTYVLHPGVTWAALLLAIAPAPLAAVAAFAPRPIARWAAVVAALVVVAGLAGWATHAGWLFAPALAALVVVCLRLWGDRP